VYAIIITQNDQKLVKSDVFCVREAWSRAYRGLEMQRFGHILVFFWIRDVLGGLVEVAWAITGPRKQWGLAKHIAKPLK
jgi:hypothetical protein